ncbi:DUF695 domain-containing protein [Alteromonas sp. ALT199]|uniref:DUF695 domain-containing protein n=1 Tax=unclassified Alteromonas TaxID=2614992 RepID=UPI001BE59FBC|nr:DUF695 domain-containing protein [Alteromonas sp. ALT199]MBT3135274.1 DUF695 domain-containing protein [Alteromonas sp. ALT199]
MTTATAENVYFTATGEQSGLPVVYRSMHAVPTGVSESDYPNLINIYWGFDVNENNGMPNETANNRQIEFEDAISSLDKKEISFLMLVATGSGRKEWVWYVKDVDSWMSQLNSLLAGHEVYPIEIEISQDPDWSTYHNFLAGVNGT